jgi:hypothetical protein
MPTWSLIESHTLAYVGRALKRQKKSAEIGGEGGCRGTQWFVKTPRDRCSISGCLPNMMLGLLGERSRLGEFFCFKTFKRGVVV